MKNRAEQLIRGVKENIQTLERCSRIQKDNAYLTPNRQCRQVDWTYCANKAKWAWKKLKATFDMKSDLILEGQSEFYYEALYRALEDGHNTYSGEIVKDKQPEDLFKDEDYDI